MKSEYKNGILLVEGSCLLGYIGFYTVKISPVEVWYRYCAEIAIGFSAQGFN